MAISAPGHVIAKPVRTLAVAITNVTAEIPTAPLGPRNDKRNSHCEERSDVAISALLTP